MRGKRPRLHYRLLTLCPEEYSCGARGRVEKAQEAEGQQSDIPRPNPENANP